MRTFVRRWPRRAATWAGFGTLIVATLLLAGCGDAAPHLSSLDPAGAASRPLAQATANPTPEAPSPRGNANSTGSFGSTTGLALPTAAPAGRTPAPPTAASAAQTPVPPPAATAPASAPANAPANATSAATQSQPLAPKMDVRWRLLYAGADGKLWSVGRDGKDPRVVLDKPAGDTPAGQPINLNLSPDGNRLLYTVKGAPGTRTFMLDLTSGTLTQQKYNGAWAADSRHLVAGAGNNQLVVVDMTNGAEEAMGEGSNANWTADNQIIAVRQGNIWLIPYPASTGAAKQLTHFPASGAGSWSFVNLLQYQYTNRILFAGSLAGSDTGIRIAAYDIPGQKLVDLVPPRPTDARFLALSPSGQQFAVAGQVPTAGCASAATIHIARVTGGTKPIQVSIAHADNDYFFLRGITWSPDQWLAYSGLEQSCAGGKLTVIAGDRIFLVNPAAPGTSRAFVDGTFPVWVAPRGLGLIDPGAMASR